MGIQHWDTEENRLIENRVLNCKKDHFKINQDLGIMKTFILFVFSLYWALQFSTVESGVGRNSDPTYDLICGQSCIEQPYDGDVAGTQCCKSHEQICCREKGHRHSCYSCKELPKEEKDNIRDIH